MLSETALHYDSIEEVQEAIRESQWSEIERLDEVIQWVWNTHTGHLIGSSFTYRTPGEIEKALLDDCVVCFLTQGIGVKSNQIVEPEPEPVV